MKRKPASLWFLALPGVLSFLAAARASETAPAAYREIAGVREFGGRLIVRPLQDGSAQAAACAALSRYDVIEHVPQLDHYIVAVPAGETENSLSARLMATGAFQYAEPDWLVFPIACPNDSRFANQWHHDANRMNSCAGWDIHTGNPTTAVGICDTGIRTTHEDFQLHRLEGYNAVDRLWESQGGAIDPIHPHGTQTTGCAAANGNNGVGVAGVGWNLSHRMLRVSNSSGGGAYLSDLQHAASVSVESGDKVANVSYSGVDSSSNLTTATYIKSIGGLLVWAAGNDSRNLTFGNRDSDDLIVVGATNSSDTLAWFSAYGIFVDLVAPGDTVYSTDADSNSDYEWVSGTSFSSPLTAGLCALIFSADSALTPDDVETILKTTCDDLGSAGIDNTYGYGRIEVFNAMSVINPADPQANFIGTPTSGDEPLFVAFTDQSTGTGLYAWSWSFGDGGTSATRHPGYTYVNPGTYTVSLTVTGTNGSDTETKVGYIAVNDVLDATATPYNGLGINPNVLTSLSLPILGTNWLADIDGGSIGATGLTFLVGYSAPLGGVVFGPGELPIDVSSPWQFTSIAGGGSGISHHSVPIPSDPVFAGVHSYAQGFLNNVGGAGKLTNAYDLGLGY
ncbi:MAG: S8 family serine peptidase [Planctomycetota bacterium]